MLDYVIEGSLRTAGVLVERQLIDWDFDHEIDVTRDDYLLSVPAPNLRGEDQTSWRFPERAHRFRARVFGMVPPGVPILCGRRPGKVRAMACRFERDHFESKTGISRCDPDQLIGLLAIDHPVFRSLFAAIGREVDRPGLAAAEYLSSLSALVLIELARRLKADHGARVGEGGLLDWQLRKLREAIHDGAREEPLTIDGLAALCGVSSRHLMRGFKAATGLTVHKYIERARIEQTKALLRADSLPLKAIAGQIGYASASHLSAAFRKSTGITPSAYRAGLRAGLYQ